MTFSRGTFPRGVIFQGENFLGGKISQWGNFQGKYFLRGGNFQGESIPRTARQTYNLITLDKRKINNKKGLGFERSKQSKTLQIYGSINKRPYSFQIKIILTFHFHKSFLGNKRIFLVSLNELNKQNDLLKFACIIPYLMAN